MKRRLASLILSAVLLCGLFAGCTPAPTPGGNGTTPGGSSSGSSSGSETDDNNGGTTAPKLQPTVALEDYSVSLNAENDHVVSYVFRVTNPNTAYQTKTRLSLLLTDAAGSTKTDFTYTPYVAPGDTICFVYIKSYSNWIPQKASFTASTALSDYKVPEKNADGTAKVTRSSDLSYTCHEQKNDSVDSNTFTGTVSNASGLASKVKVSLILKKGGRLVSANTPTVLLNVPAGGSGFFTILQPKYPSYDSFDVTVTPWN